MTTYGGSIEKEPLAEFARQKNIEEVEKLMCRHRKTRVGPNLERLSLKNIYDQKGKRFVNVQSRVTENGCTETIHDLLTGEYWIANYTMDLYSNPMYETPLDWYPAKKVTYEVWERV